MPVGLREEDVPLAEPDAAFGSLGPADAQDAGLPAKRDQLEDVRETEVLEVAA